MSNDKELANPAFGPEGLTNSPKLVYLIRSSSAFFSIGARGVSLKGSGLEKKGVPQCSILDK